MGPLGLIAGEGVFPLLVARGARAAGRKVVCAAFAGHAWPDLALAPGPPPPGGLCPRREPADAQWADIRFGFEICRTVSRLDIGQSIAVLNRDVIAVEALEGTNAMIERAGNLCRVGGWTLI